MPDNNTFITNKTDKKLILETTSTIIDLICKVIKIIGIYDVHIEDSVIYVLDNSTKKLFTIFRIDCRPLIGEGIQVSFHIDDAKKKMLGKIKGKYKPALYEIDQDFYLFNNGTYTCPIPKIKVQNIKELIPNTSNGIELNTDKYKEFKSITGKVEYVDLNIFNGKVNSIIPKNGDIAMSFEPLITSEFFEVIPEMTLRSYHFFRIDSDEVALMTFRDKNFIWLCTRINFTGEIVIEQYEPLQIIQ
ncbi:MAG: hypothetical protein HQK65_16955 [Desulfamplus sp.]|nr:hypothetical protein [Desulfamplus sp.]